ncbi:MAG: hypothetical protein RJA26_211 [Actinomycetota bacterium]|jgi:hypothetical protein
MAALVLVTAELVELPLLPDDEAVLPELALVEPLLLEEVPELELLEVLLEEVPEVEDVPVDEDPDAPVEEVLVDPEACAAVVAVAFGVADEADAEALG